LAAQNGGRSQYQQNTNFLKQLNGSDRHNSHHGAAALVQGIFGGCSLGSLAQHERNAQKGITINQASYQQVMAPKPSSKL